VVRLQNIGEGFFRDDDAAYIPAEHAATLGDHSVLPGDLLIAGLGDDNNPVGRACVAPPDLGKTMVKADCFRFRLDDSQLSARFAAYQLCSCAKAIGSSLSTGATRSRINLTSVAAVQVVHPGLGEQQKIATHIDANSERMARLVARNLEAIDKLQEYRTALISAAVTGKIDVTEAAP
jgi:type I restriction enzyme S subunit